MSVWERTSIDEKSGWALHSPTKLAVVVYSLIMGIVWALVAQAIVIAADVGASLAQVDQTHRGGGGFFLAFLMWVGSIVGGVVLVGAFVAYYNDPYSWAGRAGPARHSDFAKLKGGGARKVRLDGRRSRRRRR